MWQLVEQAGHAAGWISRALKDGVRTLEVTAEAERRWKVELDSVRIDKRQLAETCTPGYNNSEGDISKPGPYMESYDGGTLEFFEILRRWREGEYKQDTVITYEHMREKTLDMTTTEEDAAVAPGAQVVAPMKLAHVVLRTARYEELVDWYTTVFGAKITFQDEHNAFLTYDEEHHRVAILNFPGLADQPQGAAGVHHVAFTYETLEGLLANYVRLKGLGIKPVVSINHGPTTSLYYADPDGNQIELQVENFDTLEEAIGFFHSEQFANNPIGVDVDPDDLLRRLRSGEPDVDLKRRSESGPRATGTE
jgi:catechol-2,3-dioxygenase